MERLSIEELQSVNCEAYKGELIKGSVGSFRGPPPVDGSGEGTQSGVV
jgi:hypothetical protein